MKRIPAEDRKTFKVVVQDSYETGGLNWTDDMIDCFKEKYGYDPVPYIPVLSGTVVGSKDISDRFLWDLRRLIADRVAYDYVGGLREICHKHGLQTWLENYGHWGFPGEWAYLWEAPNLGGVMYERRSRFQPLSECDETTCRPLFYGGHKQYPVAFVYTATG